MQPFFSRVDFETGNFGPYNNRDKRFISHLEGYFYFEEKLKREIDGNNKLVYEVFKKNVPLNPGQLQHCITLIYPGTVGGEFFMTKGHYHKNINSAELYLCVKGEGILNLETQGDKTSYIKMNKGVWSYIPPGWAHRMINISDKSTFIFLSTWPGDAGYDYKSILKKGFSNIFVEADNKQGFKIIKRG